MPEEANGRSGGLFGHLAQSIGKITEPLEAEDNGISSGASTASTAETAGGSAASAGSWKSWQKWADDKAKKVADSARNLSLPYEAVPTTARGAYEEESNGATGSSGDIERGNGQAPSVFGWADKARQQVAEQAQQAKKNLAKAAEKARNTEFGEQAKGFQASAMAAVEKARSAEWSEQFSENAKLLQSGIGNKLGNVQESAKNATAKLQENTKGLKEIQEKGKDKIKEAAEKAKEKGQAAADKAKDKAKNAKEKAGNLASGAKGKMSGLKSGLGEKMSGLKSGLGALAVSRKTLAQFAGLFFFGTMLISLSMSFLPMLPVAPQKFALSFTFGSTCIMGSFGVLKGQEFLTQMSKKSKLPFSIGYVVGLLGTIWATIIARSYPFTGLFATMQAVSLAYFLASYIPGGQAAMNACGKAVVKGVQKVVCRKK